MCVHQYSKFLAQVNCINAMVWKKYPSIQTRWLPCTWGKTAGPLNEHNMGSPNNSKVGEHNSNITIVYIYICIYSVDITMFTGGLQTNKHSRGSHLVRSSGSTLVGWMVLLEIWILLWSPRSGLGFQGLVEKINIVKLNPKNKYHNVATPDMFVTPWISMNTIVESIGNYS